MVIEYHLQSLSSFKKYFDAPKGFEVFELWLKLAANAQK